MKEVNKLKQDETFNMLDLLLTSILDLAMGFFDYLDCLLYKCKHI